MENKPKIYVLISDVRRSEILVQLLDSSTNNVQNRL